MRDRRCVQQHCVAQTGRRVDEACPDSGPLLRHWVPRAERNLPGSKTRSSDPNCVNSNRARPHDADRSPNWCPRHVPPYYWGARQVAQRWAWAAEELDEVRRGVWPWYHHRVQLKQLRHALHFRPGAGDFNFNFFWMDDWILQYYHHAYDIFSFYSMTEYLTNLMLLLIWLFIILWWFCCDTQNRLYASFRMLICSAVSLVCIPRRASPPSRALRTGSESTGKRTSLVASSWIWLITSDATTR